MPGVVTAVANVLILAGVSTATAGVIAVNIVISAVLAAISAVVNALIQPDAEDFNAGNRARDRLRNIKQPLSPHRVIYGMTRVGGTITYLHTTNEDEELHEIITIAAHPIEEITEFYGNKYLLEIGEVSFPDFFFDPDKDYIVSNDSEDENDKANDWRGNMYVYAGLGTTESDADMLGKLVANTEGNWTTEHKQEGVSKVYLRFKYDRDSFGGGTPNLTCVVKGKLLYDPRSETTAYSNNAALCVLDYIRDKGYGLGEPDGNIDMESFITAANISDEDVALKSGETEKRYVCNGTFETSEKPSRILKNLLSSCSGMLTYQGGKWALRAGAYVVPTVEFNEDDIEGGIDVTTQVGRRNLFNQVQSVYTDPEELYQPTDAPLIKNELYLLEDQGEIITQDLEFPFTTAVTTAQRLAKIALEQVRQQISVTLTVSLRKGFQVQAGDTIGVTNTRFGWDNKAFVVTEWGMQLSDDVENPRLVVGMALRETASDVFDWNLGEETTVDAAPNTNLPNPFNVRPPLDLTITEELYFSSGGLTGSGAKVRAIVAWESAGKFVHQYEVQYKKAGDAEYIFSTLSQSSPAPVDDLAVGDYSFRVRGLNSLGTRSEFVTAEKSLLGLTAPPSDMVGFSVRALDGSAYLSWRAVEDLDVIHGGFIRIRHSPVLLGATWNDGVNIGEKLGGNVTDVVLPLIAGTYLAKAVDSSGLFSINAVSTLTTVKNVNVFNLVVTVDEEGDGFPGIKDNMVVSGSNLRLADTTIPGIYNFNNIIDLGQIYTSRVSSDFETSAFLIGDLIDNRVTLIDDWQLFDGEPSDLVSASMEVRFTDEPSNGSAWSPWQRLLVGDFKARAYDFRVVAESTDSLYNIDIVTLKAIVDMPDRVEKGRNLPVGVSGFGVVYDQEFFAEPTVGITANALGSGNHFVISNSTRTGFDIHFFTGENTPLAANFNYQSIGY